MFSLAIQIASGSVGSMTAYGHRRAECWRANFDQGAIVISSVETLEIWGRKNTGRKKESRMVESTRQIGFPARTMSRFLALLLAVQATGALAVNENGLSRDEQPSLTNSRVASADANTLPLDQTSTTDRKESYNHQKGTSISAISENHQEIFIENSLRILRESSEKFNQGRQLKGKRSSSDNIFDRESNYRRKMGKRGESSSSSSSSGGKRGGKGKKGKRGGKRGKGRATRSPTNSPTSPSSPTTAPTSGPTDGATEEPTRGPQIGSGTNPPTSTPTVSGAPTSSTMAPTAPTESPTLLPTTIAFTGRAVANETELYDAIDAYLIDPTDRQSMVAQTFGFPINSWNVSILTDARFAFSPERFASGNRRLHENPFLKSYFAGSDNVDDTAHRLLQNSISLLEFNEPLDQWDVSSVTNMASMFNGAISFNQDLNTWNVSQVTTMALMFAGAVNFNGIIGNWQTTSLLTTLGMFNSSASFNQDISQWSVSTVTDMDGMFTDAASFNIDLSIWDVSGVVDSLGFQNTFNGASALNQDFCEWGPRILAGNVGATLPSTANMFARTACLFGADPSFAQEPPGPFCTICN